MAGWLDRLQRSARQIQDAVKVTLEREQAALVVGKVAGNTVIGPDGSTIVEAGQTIGAETIERAVACGALSALVSSVAVAGIQDLQERLSAVRSSTPEGAEQRSLETVEEYAQARHCVGRIAGLDVTDIRGNVVVPKGARITEDQVRKARESGLLGALMHSASVPLDVTPDETPEDSPSGCGPNHQEGTPPERRRTLPLLDPDADRRSPAS